jgi:hypothetical protein
MLHGTQHSKWLNHMFKDHITLSAGLSIASFHLSILDVLSTRKVKEEHLRLSVDLVRSINTALNDDSKLRFSDQVIAGIIVLAASEVRRSIAPPPENGDTCD